MTPRQRHRSISDPPIGLPARRPAAWCAALAFTMLGLAGCSTPPAPSDNASTTPKRGGTLVVATSNDIAGVNELVSGASAFSQEIIERMFLDLFEEQPDFTEHPPSFEPRLAESSEWSDDRLTLTVRLRPGVTWSDGVPLTADDVRWSWQAQTDPGVGWAYAQSKERITDVEVVDDLTVRFRFDRVYATQMSDVNEGVVLPRHAWSQVPFAQWPESEDWFRDNLVVSGPYTLASWRPQEEIVLQRNPAYFEPQRPLIDRVVFRIIPERSNQVTEILRGEIDFVPRLDPRDAERIEQASDVALMPYWHRQYTYLGWNTKRGIFSDPATRQALTIAIDRQALIDTLMFGYARVAVSPIISTVWAFNDALEPWPHDPQAARSGLQRLGWIAGSDGVLARDGERFAFELAVNASSRTWRDAATMIQEQLRQVGIDVAIRPMEFHTWIARMEAHDYDATIGAFSIDTSLDLTYAFHSDSIGDGYNFGGYSNARVDELIDEVKRQVDPLDAGPHLLEIQEILHAEQPFTFLWEPQRLSARRYSVHGVDPNPQSIYYNLRDWWIE